jgi:plasmid replication initiation protein
VARLRTLQERARDEQAERDALRARRAQEQAEREWRRKEAEEARRQAETEAMLIAAREQQMTQKQHFLAVQAQRERNDFERVLRLASILYTLNLAGIISSNTASDIDCSSVSSSCPACEVLLCMQARPVVGHWLVCP